MMPRNLLKNISIIWPLAEKQIYLYLFIHYLINELSFINFKAIDLNMKSLWNYEQWKNDKKFKKKKFSHK